MKAQKNGSLIKTNEIRSVIKNREFNKERLIKGLGKCFQKVDGGSLAVRHFKMIIKILNLIQMPNLKGRLPEWST